MALYLSKHIDSSLACWIEAVVYQFAVHATWDAYLCTRYENDSNVNKVLLFKRYFCSAEMFLDWIKRGVITKVVKSNDSETPDIYWDELEKTLKACVPLISIPLTEKSENYLESYRNPDSNLFYEVIVDSFCDKSVNCAISLWGYKYKIENISIGKDPFYILTDRLEARIRFISDWASIDEHSRELSVAMAIGDLYDTIKYDLAYQIKSLKTPSEQVIKSACMSVFPVLEKFLRSIAVTKGWKTKNLTLDPLIKKFESANLLSDDTIQLLWMVAKPYRDAVSHGKYLTISVSKVVLATLFDVFVRIGNDLSLNTKNAQPGHSAEHKKLRSR